MFHTVVGHYVGCGWSVEQILQHLQQFPDGIAGRYLSEGRLTREIARSASKYTADRRRCLAMAGPTASRQRHRRRNRRRRRRDDPELEDDDRRSSRMRMIRPPQQDPKLPPLYAHGDADPRPLKSWLIKHLIPAAAMGC